MRLARRKALLVTTALAGIVLGRTGQAGPALAIVASFSILGDMVREIGGGRVALVTLVGPDGDAHVYEPTPADAKAVGDADLVVMNGLGFEGWLSRLLAAAAYRGPVVTASDGIAARAMDETGPAHGHDHHADLDPHAWQDLARGAVYVDNIAHALSRVDPAGAALYAANAAAYKARLAALDREARAAIARLPADRRRIVTSHAAFGYFAAAYGLEVLAPEGMSTESEASAADVAALIRQIRALGIPAVFVENVSDPRLLAQITRETGARIGGTLYTDALSGPDGPAPTYEAMFRHNLAVLLAALGS